MISNITRFCIVLFLGGIVGPASVWAQEQPYNGIKLFVKRDYGLVYSLPDNVRDRVFDKITQLITGTGIAEEGFSNFYLVPKIDTIGSYVDDAGPGKIYTAECELTLSVENSYYKSGERMTFTSMTKRLTGSSARPQDAWYNAISNISPKDPKLQAFLQESKSKISNYFRQHCREVLESAQQAYDIGNYRRSISIYFSIPSDVPRSCYDEALKGIQRTYRKFVSQDCEQQLLWLKACVARAQTTNTAISDSSYKEIMSTILGMDPASSSCYGEALRQIEKIERRFDLQQKQDWELRKKAAGIKDSPEVNRQIHEAAAHVSNQYQAAIQAMPVPVPTSPHL